MDYIPQGEVIRETRTAPESAARSSYRAYLNSPGWRLTRNAALRRAGWKCSRCSSRRNLEVHHKSYERLGREHDDDLEVVCPDCHRCHHIKTAADEFAVYVRLASSVLIRHQWDSISELSGAIRDECARVKLPYDAGQADRALNLVIGKRLQVIKPGQRPEPHAIGVTAYHPITKAEAYELVARIFQDAKPMFIKTMPPAEKPLAEQLAHEAKIAQQIAEIHRQLVPRKRRSIQERLEAVFAGEYL